MAVKLDPFTGLVVSRETDGEHDSLHGSSKNSRAVVRLEGLVRDLRRLADSRRDELEAVRAQRDTAWALLDEHGLIRE
jgi:hypothetical protein